MPRMLILLLLAMGSVWDALGQMEYKAYVQAYAGNFPAMGIKHPSFDTSITVTANPGLVYGLRADILAGTRFSFGIVHGWQKISVNFLSSGKTVETGQVNKLYLGFRGLVYYGKNRAFYSGFKMGYVYKRPIRVKTNPGQTPYLSSFNNDIVFQPGLILIGAFYLFTERMGAGAELSVGNPSVLSMGLRMQIL